MSATFRNDYNDMAAPEVLKAILDAQDEVNVGYGYDVHSSRAEALILKRFGIEDGKVFFLSGGTQTNLVVISYLLRSFESVVAIEESHINVHETGSVEGTGHKILTYPGVDGKLQAQDIEKAYLESSSADWTPTVKLVYITQATEGGTLYTRSELLAIREVCDRHGLYLFIDGARLASALTSPDTDVTAELIGQVADVFYVGGTKCGAMFGEAVVFTNRTLATEFRPYMKNRGALLAKGHTLGVQFEALFTNDLYFRLAKRANDMADYIRDELDRRGVSLEGSGRTNQLFIRFTKEKGYEMFDRFGLEIWSEDDHSILSRIVTTYRTTTEDCDELIDAII